MQETVSYLFSVGENHKAVMLQRLLAANKKVIEHFESMKFDTCCSGRDCGCMGMPIDPEYYLLQLLKEAQKDD